MWDVIEMVKYKLMRVRHLATIRHARWFVVRFFYPDALLTTQISEGVRIQYTPQGNVSRDLFLGQFEHDVIDFLEHYLKPGMIVFDVGANIGVYSLLSAKYVGEHGGVHAFEPTPKIFAQLCDNVELNGFTCVHLNQLAVKEKSGTSMLYLYEQNAMNSLSRQDWVGRPLGQVEVETISLDEYISAHELPGVDLLKVDVEGAELAVLQGARGLLSRPDAPIVLCEFADKTARAFGYQATSIRDYLEPLGYQFFRWDCRIGNLVPEPRAPNYKIYANLVCIRGDD
jgi:FkbM family methyltransferase